MNVALSLAERGWIEIDSATVRARGDVQTVISQMQATLEQPDVICLCSRLGIYSAGVMFFDRFTRMTRFFRTDDTPQPTYATQYISPTKAISAAEFEGIHNLFLLIREEQALWAKGDDPDHATAPDYFRYLPRSSKELCALAPEEEAFRERYAIHYCTVGEMVVTTFLWRALSRLQQAGLGDSTLDDALHGSLRDLTLHPRLMWKGADMWERLAELDSSAALLQRWREDIGDAPHWRDDWSALGLEGPTGVTRRLAALRFCQALDGRANPDDWADSDVFGERLLAALSPLLQKLDPDRAATMVTAALEALETVARFPIVPFYVWNALEASPHVYCIVPVWTSQAYPFLENHHQGFALTALRPNRELDWSIRDLQGLEEEGVAADIDPLIITSLLRLVARPLVEHSLYGNLVKQAQEDETQRHSANFNQAFGKWAQPGKRAKRRRRRK